MGGIGKEAPLVCSVVCGERPTIFLVLEPAWSVGRRRMYPLVLVFRLHPDLPGRGAVFGSVTALVLCSQSFWVQRVRWMLG